MLAVLLPTLLTGTALAAPEIHLEGSAQVLPTTAALDIRARADGERDAYVLGAVRVDPTGQWIGRAGVGIDVLGSGDGIDLKLGLFLGGTGDAGELTWNGRPAAGGEIQLGVSVGRVFGSYRHMDGFAGPLEDRLTEDELRLGFALTDRWRVHGQALEVNPGDGEWRPSFGLGVEAVF